MADASSGFWLEQRPPPPVLQSHHSRSSSYPSCCQWHQLTFSGANRMALSALPGQPRSLMEHSPALISFSGERHKLFEKSHSLDILDLGLLEMLLHERSLRLQVFLENFALADVGPCEYVRGIVHHAGVMTGKNVVPSVLCLPMKPTAALISSL